MSALRNIILYQMIFLRLCHDHFVKVWMHDDLIKGCMYDDLWRGCMYVDSIKGCMYNDLQKVVCKMIC